MRDPDHRRKWGKKVAKLFPGDVIHDQAGISTHVSSSAKIQALDEAVLKRLRKQQKRKKELKS